jgi:hypothetical protein
VAGIQEDQDLHLEITIVDAMIEGVVAVIDTKKVYNRIMQIVHAKGILTASQTQGEKMREEETQDQDQNNVRETIDSIHIIK